MEYVDTKIDYFDGWNPCSPMIFSLYHKNPMTLFPPSY